ncbi:MAG: hypothetical protein ACOX0L_04995 [Natronincolaceae bacterium]|jgi:hypothetical protein|nr:hypothetical protein [Bacillota bacterium]NLK91229.1 hypothetical protein [Clostridiales bacterium]
MAYLLRKHKNIVWLTLLLVFVLIAWYIFINKDINAIPEKADLVLISSNVMRDV